MEAFEELWAAVNGSRLAAKPGQNPSPANFTKWWSEWKEAAPPALRVGSLRAGQCADVDSCIGLNGTHGHCVCNNAAGGESSVR